MYEGAEKKVLESKDEARGSKKTNPPSQREQHDRVVASERLRRIVSSGKLYIYTMVTGIEVFPPPHLSGITAHVSGVFDMYPSLW